MVERSEESMPEGETKPEPPAGDKTPAKEFGGRDGPEPTRYGDWEVKGICVDF